MELEDQNLSRADFVYRRLRQGIRSGDFRPGDRMREAELAARLNVSRTPIREAIRRLASEGFLELAASRGVMVVQLDKRQVRELYALREVLEGTAARLAAHHASANEVEEMRDLLARPGPAGDPQAAARLNDLFHRTIRDAAHNRYLAHALEQLSDSLALLPGTTLATAGRGAAAAMEHLAIVAAIDAHDPAAAEAAARDHIRAAGQIRLRMMFATDDVSAAR